MSDIKSHDNVIVGSERSFGIVFSIVFFIISFLPLLKGGEVKSWAAIISIIFLLLAFFSPRILMIPNRLWFNFGLFLGNIVSPIIMAMIFYIMVTPTGLVMKIFRKDILSYKINKRAKTYWISRKEATGSMKDQF